MNFEVAPEFEKALKRRHGLLSKVKEKAKVAEVELFFILKLSKILNETKTGFIDLKTPDGIRRVQINRLLAVESLDRRKVKVYIIDSILPEVCCSLSQLHKLLPSNFRYIFRDCFVNILEIKHLNLK